MSVCDVDVATLNDQAKDILKRHSGCCKMMSWVDEIDICFVPVVVMGWNWKEEDGYIQ